MSFEGAIYMADYKNKITKRLCIDLPEEQYYFLKERGVILQRQGKKYSGVAIIRELIEKDKSFQKWKKEKNDKK